MAAAPLAGQANGGQVSTCPNSDVIFMDGCVMHTYTCGAPATVEVDGGRVCANHARILALGKEIREAYEEARRAGSTGVLAITGKLAAHDAYREPTA